jgi:hypothetical protein
MASTKFNNFIKKMRETTGSTSFKESRYGEVKHWISTGSYALNRILSGSIYKGIPSGKVVLISGENSTGKSLISAKIMANALNEGFDHIFYFDSEGGALRDFFENVGCDTEKIEQILVQSVEEAQLQILNVYNMIQEFKEKNPDEDVKFLCVLDSLGALVAEKVTRDADKGKVASEMGGRAKLCLPGDTLVYMADGTYKLLKDIQIDDEVITHLGRARKVIDHFKTNHEKVVKVKYIINNEEKEIKMSLNHKMLVKRDGEILEIPANELLKTDKLLQFNA